MYQIIRGLTHLHAANIVHRDLKPSNLLVNSNCDLVICDFGLARGVDDGVESADATSYITTRYYRAPEVLMEASYGKGVDVWAAGCIMAELIGRKHFIKGASTMDQISRIMDMLGPLTPEWMELLGKSPSDVKGPIPLKTLLPGASDLALDLLGRMLTIDPQDRATIEECLAHPYLSIFPPVTVDSSLPPFDWRFEADYIDKTMPAKLIQRLIMEELLYLRECQLAAGWEIDKPLPAPAPVPSEGVEGVLPFAPAVTPTAASGTGASGFPVRGSETSGRHPSTDTEAEADLTGVARMAMVPETEATATAAAPSTSPLPATGAAAGGAGDT